MGPLACLLGTLLSLLAGIASAAAANADAAPALHAKYAALEPSLQQNPFGRALVLQSIETPNSLQGEVYAIVDFPLAAVTAAVSNPDHWCDVMVLHINTKYCHAATGPGGTALTVNIGRKTPEQLADTARVEFKYQVSAAATDYVQVVLDAKEGPLGTRNYRILVEATTLPGEKTFLHLIYAYEMNLAARLAMKTYLATVASDKVGFTLTGTEVDGRPGYIGGVRGLVERNTMRYFLAIDSYLAALGVPPPAQLEHRLQSWFAATEQYPRQLHETERADYLSMKHAEYARQQTVQ
jgi:hypothetical protein